MNKLSKSLSIIITSTNDTKFNINLKFKQHIMLSPKDSSNDDNDSFTDVSIINQTSTSSNSTLQSNTSKYDPFISNEQIFHSLIAYANSFNLDETIYSMQDLKNQLDSTNSSKQLTSSSFIQYDNLINANNNIVEDNSIEIIPLNCFSPINIESNDNNIYNDESTTITDGSKFQWEYLSDTIDHSIKSSNNINHSENFSHQISSSSSTPIIIQEVLSKPSSSTHLLSTNITEDYPSISSTHRHTNKQSKKIIIIEYDQINVMIDKDIKQRKEIKRINPNQYIQQYGSSLCSKEVFYDLLTNIIS